MSRPSRERTPSTTRITVRLTADELAKLDRIAADTRSERVRKLLRLTSVHAPCDNPSCN